MPSSANEITLDETPMNSVQGKFVWIMAHTEFKWLWAPLADKVKAATGLEPILIVSTELDAESYRDGFALDQIVVSPNPLQMAIDTEGKYRDQGRVLAEARRYEKEYGMTFMRDIIQANRHLGRGFTLGWNGLPRSGASEATDDITSIGACLDMLRFFESLVASHPPALIVAHGSGTGIWGKPFSLVARRYGIEFRNFSSARIGGLYYWAKDEFENDPQFEELANGFGEVSDEDITTARAAVIPTEEFRRYAPKYVELEKLTTLLPRIAHVLVHHLYMRFRRYERAVYGDKPLSTVRRFVQVRRDVKYLENPPFLTFDQLPQNRKLVYFPLQVEPEASLQAQTPECMNQFAVLIEVALSLPADALLVVKEHPIQFGLRPREFYDRILALPNAVMMRPSVSSLQLIEASHLICTLNGSAAFEGSILGKPAAYFSRHGLVRCVNHVKRPDNYDELAWIRDALDSDDAASQEERARDGARFYHALRAYCMDLSGIKFFDLDDSERVRHYTEIFASHLLSSIPQDICGRRPEHQDREI